MAEIVWIGGAEGAIIGTYVNEHGNEVAVYSIQALTDQFLDLGRTLDDLEDWIDSVYERVDITLRPVFIDYQPNLGRKLKELRGAPN